MREPKRTERDGFAQVLRAQWTAFYKSRILVAGMLVAALLTILLGLLYAATGVGSNHVSIGCGGNTVCSSSSAPTEELIGPDGEAVNDKFYFVYQPLAGNGSITARLISMTGEIARLPPNANLNVSSIVLVPGVEPWAKAGVIIKQSLKQGSSYAAMMITGSYGVRMQYNFTHDIAGMPGHVSATSPRWLRLTRSGDTLTGYDSTNGTQWTRVGTAQLAGLPATVQIGLFATSPCDLTVDENGQSCRFAQTTAVFDHVSLQGGAPHGTWSRDDVGVTIDPDGKPHHPGSLVESGGTFTVTGNGDIASLGTADSPDSSRNISRTVIGAVAGLIMVILVAVLFITAKTPDDHISIPKRVTQERRVVVAKAVVLGLVAFTTQLVAVVIAAQLGEHIMLANGGVLPVSFLTELRVIVGTAAGVAIAAVFALALGALFRRRVVAIAVGLALTIIPFILAFANLLPEVVSQWLLRLTPSAGFAIQQSAQVTGVYTIQAGYYPLAPWAGFAVLCGYAVLALSLAVFVSRRKDA